MCASFASIFLSFFLITPLSLSFSHFGCALSPCSPNSANSSHGCDQQAGLKGTRGGYTSPLSLAQHTIFTPPRARHCASSPLPALLNCNESYTHIYSGNRAHRIVANSPCHAYTMLCFAVTPVYIMHIVK